MKYEPFLFSPLKIYLLILIPVKRWQLVESTFNVRFYNTISSVYLFPNTPVEREEINSVFRQLLLPFKVQGDFNGRHPLCGDSVINRTGDCDGCYRQ